MFLFDIFEALLAYDLSFLKEQTTMHNGHANGQNRGNKMTGPGCLQRGVN